MPRFRKDVLKAGRYSVPGHAPGERRLVEYTKQDIRHLAKRWHDMHAAGLHVPTCWEHQDGAKPASERLADKARLTIGYADDASVLGMQGDKLAFALDVPDEEEAKRAKTVRFVSPEIVEDWTDGSGRFWPGKSITHVAITSHPVQHNQDPLQPLAAGEKLSTVRLSLADRLGGLTMAAEDLDEGADPKFKKDKGNKDDNGPPLEVPEESAADPNYSIDEVMSGLEKKGIHLPPGTNEENLMAHLCVALHALNMADGIGDEDLDMDLDKPPEEAPKPAPGSDPVMMSLQKRVKQLEAEKLESENAKMASDIKALFKGAFIPKPVFDYLNGKLKSTRLSMSETGAVNPTTLAAQIEVLKMLKPGTAFATERLSQAVEVPQPEEPTRLDTEVLGKLTKGRYQTNGAK